MALLRRIKDVSGKTVTTLFFSLLATTGQTDEQQAPPMDDRFYLAAGSYHVFNADSTLSLVSRNAGAGAAIRPNDTLGLDLENTVLKVKGRYRFTPKSQLVLSWYELDANATRNLESDVEWVDRQGNPTTIAAGSKVESGLEYDIAKASYYWSFYHNDKVELMAGAGLHVSRFAIDLDVLTDPSGTLSASGTRNAAQTIPLPTVGFGLHYQVNPKLRWFMQAEGFYLEYDTWKGLFTDLEVGLEYNVWKQLGVGVGLASDSLTVTESDPDYRFRYDNTLSGAHFFLSWTQ